MLALRSQSPLFYINCYSLQETALSRDPIAVSQREKNHSTGAKADYGAMTAGLSAGITLEADNQETSIDT